MKHDTMKEVKRETDAFILRKGRCSMVRLKDNYPSFEIAMQHGFAGKTYLYVPEVIYFIYTFTGCSLEQAKNCIVKYYKEHKENISFERTSEIFITGVTRGGRAEKRRLRFFILHENSWISHFILRKPFQAPTIPSIIRTHEKAKRK